nr:hypothetical protein [Tanacetum cinerariifolium]
SDSYEFTDELIPFISALEYDCFRFTVEPNSRDFTKVVVKNISPTKGPQGDMLIFEEFLKDDHSSDSQSKSSSTFLNSLLEETTSFHNSLPAGFTTFSNVLFDADYDSDSSDDQSLLDEDNHKFLMICPPIPPFNYIDSHMEEIDLSLNPDEPNSRDLTKDVVEDIS